MYREFPAFIKNLPKADLPFNGLRGWLIQSDNGQVQFNESDIELNIPEHSHGDQWGVVVDGKITLVIGTEICTYEKGDSYFIPANIPHKATIYPGFKAIDYFADCDRYKTSGPSV